MVLKALLGVLLKRKTSKWVKADNPAESLLNMSHSERWLHKLLLQFCLPFNFIFQWTVGPQWGQMRTIEQGHCNSLLCVTLRPSKQRLDLPRLIISFTLVSPPRWTDVGCCECLNPYSVSCSMNSPHYESSVTIIM